MTTTAANYDNWTEALNALLDGRWCDAVGHLDHLAANGQAGGRRDELPTEIPGLEACEFADSILAKITRYNISIR